MIYAILEIDPGVDADSRRVKIGVTGQDARTRLGSLQTGNSRKLEIIAKCAGDVSTERALHVRFAHLNISGEWFWYRAELVDEISTWPQQIPPDVVTPGETTLDGPQRKRSRRVWAKDRDARFKKWARMTKFKRAMRQSRAA